MWRRQFDIGICILTTVLKYRNTLRIIKINKQQKKPHQQAPTNTEREERQEKQREREYHYVAGSSTKENDSRKKMETFQVVISFNFHNTI